MKKLNTNFKKKAWVGLGALTFITGLLVTIMIMMGSEIEIPVATAFTVLISSLFIVLGMYASHISLRWATWGATVTVGVMQIIYIWNNGINSSSLDTIQYWIILGWCVSVSLVALSLFSLSYRFAKNLKIMIIGYWITLGLGGVAVIFMIAARIHSLMMEPKYEYSYSYMGDSEFFRYGVAAYVMTAFTALIVATFSIIARKQEVAIEKKSIAQVDQFLNSSQNLTNQHSVNIDSSNSTEKINVYLQDENFKDAFIHMISLYEKGLLVKSDSGSTDNDSDTESSKSAS